MYNVSVIVPVYNVECYIAKCITSLLSQTLSDIEIIIVNDGSTDDSLLICEQFQKKYSNIKVINQNNQGVSSARNNGMAIASGKYISFIDPDDWVEQNMLEAMFEKAESVDSDIVICDFFKDDDNENSKEIISLEVNVKEENLKNFLLENTISGYFKPSVMGSVCRLLVKNKYIKQTKLQFNESVKIMEDLLFCIDLYLYTNKISYVQFPFYHYVLRSDSAVQSYKFNILENNMQVYTILNEKLTTLGIAENLENRLDLRYLDMYFNFIINEIKLNKNDSFFSKLRTVLKSIMKDEKLLNLAKKDIKGFSNMKKKYIFKLLKVISKIKGRK